MFQTKDQIGSFFYFPSINFQKMAGGFGPIRVNNRNVIAVPFPKPEAEFDLLIGDWSFDNYKVTVTLDLFLEACLELYFFLFFNSGFLELNALGSARNLDR